MIRYRVDLCEKWGGGGWGVSSIKPKNYTTVLLGVSGVSVPVLWVFCFLFLSATWAVPVGVAAPCGRHLWGTEKNDRCVKKLVYIYISGAGGDICCVWEGVRGWV